MSIAETSILNHNKKVHAIFDTTIDNLFYRKILLLINEFVTIVLVLSKII